MVNVRRQVMARAAIERLSPTVFDRGDEESALMSRAYESDTH